MGNGRHEKRRAVNIARIVEGRMAVSYACTQVNSAPSTMVQIRPHFRPLRSPMQQRMMRPGDGRAGGEQDQRVEQRQVPGIEGFNALGGHTPPNSSVARDVMQVGRKQRAGEVGQNQATKNITSEAMNRIMP